MQARDKHLSGSKAEKGRSKDPAKMARANTAAPDKEADRLALAAIVEGSRDALWSWNLDGTIIRWNAEAQRLFGYSANEIIGHSLLLLVPNDRRQRAREVIQEIAQGKWYDKYETVRIHKDGSRLDVELTVSPIFDKGGKVVEGLSSCRDISERKRIQSALAGRVNELTTLIRLTEQLQSAETFDDIYAAALTAIRDALNCERSSILLFDAGGVMRFVAWRGLSDEYRAAVNGHSPWSPDSDSPEPICIDDIATADQPAALKSVVQAEDIRGLAFIPLVSKGKLIGKFMTYYREPHAFSTEETQLANTIARQLAIAIDRQMAKDDLRESETRFRLMSESAPVMIWMSDAHGKCLHLNQMLRSFWGVKEADIAQFNWHETMHPDEAAVIGQKMFDALVGRTSVSIKGTYRNASGDYRILQTEARPRFSAAGEFLGMIGVNVDITEQEQTKKQIAADLAAMTRLQELSTLCAREGHDQAKCLSAVVETAIAITGAPRGSLQLLETGSDALTIAAQHGFDDTFLRFFARVQHNAPVTAAAAMRAKDRFIIEDVAKSEIFYDKKTLNVLLHAGVRAVQATPLIDANGKVFGVISTHFSKPHRPQDRELRFIDLLARQTADYLSRIQAEDALHSLQNRLQVEVETRTRERDRIWNVSEDLLGVSNFEGYYLSINPAWQKTLGWSDDEIKALHVNDLHHPDDAASFQAGREQLARGVPTVRMENRFRHKDGSWRWIAWTMTADQGLIYVAGRHITAEKEAAAALQRAQEQLSNAQKMEALGQLTGGVAHDFNNIMMIVSGYAHTLKNRLTDSKNVRALRAIEGAVSRGESLTRQLLSFSRHQPLNPVVLHPSEAIEAIRDVLSGSATGKIELSLDIPADCWPIHVDKSEFALALINIALNARDAMPNGGVLSIKSENVTFHTSTSPGDSSGEFVAFKISDTGCGIPASIVSKVFDPFFTTKEVEKGTGLGLSQVYGFVRRSGGTVFIESEEQQGTTVTLYLPRSQQPMPSEMNDRGLRPKGGRQESILVVEDNVDVRRVAMTLLRELGHRTIEADSATAALRKLEEEKHVDLVFSDIVLSGSLDGVCLSQEIAVRHPRTAVLLTTGYARSVDTELNRPVLRKPYDIVTLDRAVRDAIENHRLMTEGGRVLRTQIPASPAYEAAVGPPAPTNEDGAFPMGGDAHQSGE
jgi:PAS domain S-box-containing protein